VPETEPPPSPLTESSASEAVYSEPEDIPPIAQNFKLCTWRSSQGSTILSDSATELTLAIEKHTTVSFVGCFDVHVVRGAVNIHGANIGTPRRNETKKSHRVFVPSTHPITKIRGLDRLSHIRISSCEEPTPFADISPLFANIWSGNEDSSDGRSFTLVRLCRQI